MYSFRCLVLLPALCLPAARLLPAQDTASTASATPASPSLSTPSPASSPAPRSQDGAQAQTQADNGGQSVQARIRARREARRAQAIQQTYSSLYEAFVGMGFVRFTPGFAGFATQRTNLFAWNVAVTRYYSQRFGITFDGRGYYGTAFVGIANSPVTEPAISQYAVMAGPTYRLYRRPRFSVSVHGLGGVTVGNFSGDTSGLRPVDLGLFPDSTTYALDGSIIGEYNLAPNLSLRLAGDYYLTGFHSGFQTARGLQTGFVYRFGRQ